MDRMKTLLIYVILLVVLYFFVDFVSFAYIKTTYNDLTNFIIDVPNPKIRINEAKTTYVNGHIKGSLLNNSEEEIKEQYLKFEFFSERDVQLGKKYIKIENLQPNATRDFEVGFQFEGVTSYKITVADLAEVQRASEEEFVIDADAKAAMIIITLLFLYF